MLRKEGPMRRHGALDMRAARGWLLAAGCNAGNDVHEDVSWVRMHGHAVPKALKVALSKRTGAIVCPTVLLICHLLCLGEAYSFNAPRHPAGSASFISLIFLGECNGALCPLLVHPSEKHPVT